MVSTLVYQSLHGDYCATYVSCDFMVTLNITIFKMLWSPENQKIGFFDTLAPSCCNPCLLKLVYSLWYDKLVMYHLWWPKIGHTENCFGHLKVEKYGFGKLSLCGANSYVSQFVKGLLYNMWLYNNSFTDWLCDFTMVLSSSPGPSNPCLYYVIYK